MQNAGFRSHRVITGTEGTLDKSGSFLLVEVSSATDTLFYPNKIDPHTGLEKTFIVDGIPIKAGATRVIPMAVYNFKADAEVTVVAYRM